MLRYMEIFEITRDGFKGISLGSITYKICLKCVFTPSQAVDDAIEHLLKNELIVYVLFSIISTVVDHKTSYV